MNLLKEVSENKFLLILLTEERYTKQIYEIVRSVELTKNKICYVCISRPYTDVFEFLNKNGIDTKSFIFIDVLSSHYGIPAPIENCVFLDAPDLEPMKRAIENILEKENCTVLLFDTLSTMLMYQERFPILKFAHSMTLGAAQKNVKKIFFVLKKDEEQQPENVSLINDMKMFADKTLEMN